MRPRLADAVAQVPGIEGAGALITIADDQLTVRLTRGIRQLERRHVEARLAAALAAGGRIVEDSNAPAHWTLVDRAGNRVCVCAWPDGATS
jgi:glyoxalase superfamily protein